MTTGEYIGWVGTTLAVPVAVPFLVLWVATKAFEITDPKKLYRSAVKDGQLLWISVSLAAAALFDTANGMKELPKAGWAVVAWYGGVLVVCSCLISMWTAGSLNVPVAGAGNGLKLKEDSLISLSTVILLATSVSYGVVKLLV